MDMSPAKSATNTKICPTCGTRLNENATRCLVCGRTFTVVETKANVKAVQAPRLPEITLSLPLALGMIAIFLAIGAIVVFFLLRSTGRVVEPTVTATPTTTATVTITPTASLTPTIAPSFTPLPPVEYIVKSGDLCSSISYTFDVAINTIILANNLDANCTLSIGQVLLIPQPTPTPSPMPSATLSEVEATEDACEKFTYTVTENDTLSSISLNYNISIDAIKEENGLTSDIVYSGQPLVIPLCRRNPTAGPTPTATLPPPYPASSLLLPADGSVFMALNETITLQWAAVGTLRENEMYQVSIEDITDGTGRKLVDYVSDTKYIVPESFRPTDDRPHIIRWSIMPVRQTGTDENDKPIWDSAGTPSIQRVFSWWGGNIASPTP
jgi:LysM repeat protein